MKPTLEKFLNSSERNAWVVFTSSKGQKLESYVRKGPRVLEGTRYNKVLDRANTNVTGAKAIRTMVDSEYPMAGTGAYREFDQHMLALAKQYEFDAIFVEQVLNPCLPKVLLRYGYTHAPDSGGFSFYKVIKGDHDED